jgi:cyclin H
VEDELKLLKYYASKIQGICQALHFPAKVRATALLYLKRAYLTFSALDHNPKDIMLACIYLAGKVGCHLLPLPLE